jgi:SAM-dependent methyltransferase
MNGSPLIDAANAAFWDELCGSAFARALGILDHSKDSLNRFDRAYLGMYPYLLRHVPVNEMRDRDVLEIGLGYGTLSQQIAQAGARYNGLDIAAGPVRMVNHRLAMASLGGKAVQGSMLECPFPDGSMDRVVSIGCFHHTGDLKRCIDETWRVLRPGGVAHIMVYNLFSYRQWLRWPLATMRAALGRSDAAIDAQRKAYDANVSGEGAPETVFTSIAQLRAMMTAFSIVSVARENCDPVTLRGRLLIPRALLLDNLGRLSGLDLYATARK